MSTIKDFCPPVTVHFQEPEKTSRWYYASYGHIKNSHISKVTTKASGNSERMATLMTQISQNKHQLPVSTDSSNSQFSLIYQGFPTFCTPPSQIVWQWEGGVHFIISWVISHIINNSWYNQARFVMRRVLSLIRWYYSLFWDSSTLLKRHIRRL